MDIKNIVTKREYVVNGEKKAAWFTVGSLKTTDEGKQFIELGMYPGTSFYVFPRKNREEQEQL